MSFIEDLLRQDRLVATLGVRAREKARAAGVSVFHIDPASDDTIIEERADGTLIRHFNERVPPAPTSRKQRLGGSK